MAVFNYSSQITDTQRLTAKKREILANESNIYHKKDKKKDIYTDSPVRYLGFANEVGAAISPAAGAILEMATYGPALGYIAMDVIDKHKRGDNDDYKKCSDKRATKQLVFQLLASVLLPTCIVKTAQTVTDKAINKFRKPLSPIIDPIKNFVKKSPDFSKFIDNFKDKEFNKHTAKSVDKFAKGFVECIEKVTVVPWLFKKCQGDKAVPKSGMRNIGLALVGITALLAAIKPIDKFTEHFISKAIHPLLYGNKKQNIETKETKVVKKTEKPETKKEAVELSKESK